ncbi:MAG: hypothetical protein RKK15_03625 [Defluviicoccus sp.]|nr:hypothetical protein [Defluviicoccus sp.]
MNKEPPAMAPALPSRPPAALTIAALQAQLRTGQARSKGTTARPPVPLGLAAIDRTLPWGGLPRGCLHEILAADASAAAAAFAAVLLARFAGRGGHVLWCRRRRGLYAPGLAGMGLDPTRLLMVHVEREADVLCVMEDALRCSALAAVLGETTALAPIGLRRLQLAAEASGGTALLLRPGVAAAAAAWAVTRWQVGAVPGIADAPGIRSRWRLELLRCRSGPAGAWVVEWCDETDRLALAAELRHRPPAPAAWHPGRQPSARAG